MRTFNYLLKEIMQTILYGENKILQRLREQYDNSEVISIEKSNAGCYIDFKVNNGLAIDLKNFYIADVFIKLENLLSPVGTVLFIENGYLATLEMYTYGEDIFPDFFGNYILYYEKNREKNNFIKI